MKFKGELKEKLEKAKSKEQAKEILDNVGLELSDEELKNVTGGSVPSYLQERPIIPTAPL